MSLTLTWDRLECMQAGIGVSITFTWEGEVLEALTRGPESWKRWKCRYKEIWVKKHVSPEIWSLQKVGLIFWVCFDHFCKNCDQNSKSNVDFGSSFCCKIAHFCRKFGAHKSASRKFELFWDPVIDQMTRGNLDCAWTGILTEYDCSSTVSLSCHYVSLTGRSLYW